MLKYDFMKFCEWMDEQPGGTPIMKRIGIGRQYLLHDIMNAFRMDVEIEDDRMERERTTRQPMPDYGIKGVSSTPIPMKPPADDR